MESAWRMGMEVHGEWNGNGSAWGMEWEWKCMGNGMGMEVHGEWNGNGNAWGMVWENGNGRYKYWNNYDCFIVDLFFDESS